MYLGARSEERAKAAIRRIEEQYPHVKDEKNVLWLPLDLAEPASIVRSAKDLMARETRLDILGWSIECCAYGLPRLTMTAPIQSTTQRDYSRTMRSPTTELI